jgi:hypothetical protein
LLYIAQAELELMILLLSLLRAGNASMCHRVQPFMLGVKNTPRAGGVVETYFECMPNMYRLWV